MECAWVLTTRTPSQPPALAGHMAVALWAAIQQGRQGSRLQDSKSARRKTSRSCAPDECSQVATIPIQTEP
jgi:hypothetical protein